MAQRRSLVLLKDDGLLPLGGRPRIYIEGVDAAALGDDAEVVGRPEGADVALIRLQTPYEPRDGLFLEQFFHAGRLDFDAAELERLLAVLRTVPTVVEITLERAAVIPELAEAAAVLVAGFGASDAAVLDLVFGRVAAGGRLPVELPSSMEAVERQHPDVPYDSDDPVFPFGAGIVRGEGTQERG